MSNRTCSVVSSWGEPCERPHWANGLCAGHNHRLYKKGDVLADKPFLDRSLDARGRYELHVLVQEGCYGWEGTVNNGGYASFWDGEREIGAHVFVWTEAHGPVPDGYEVDHTCHNADPVCPGGKTCLHRQCSRIEHLEAVPALVNVQRGKGWASRDACIRGHEYNEINTRYDENGWRRCRVCDREKPRGPIN